MPFNIALSGLNAAAADLAVTGNNIANASTTGFKESRTEFTDVYASSYQGISNLTPGSGVRVAGITQQFSQGNTSYTDNSLDLTINGQGFFRVESANGDEFLTRSGEFHVDRDNTIINNRGQYLLGYPAGAVGANPGPIVLDTSTGVANPTSEIEGVLNLPTLDTIPIDAATVPFDETDPSTYHEQTATTVYDSQGTPLSANFYFRRLDPESSNTWETYAFVDGQSVPPAGGVAGDPSIITFNPDGTLNSLVPADPQNPLAIDFEPTLITAGTNLLNISFDLGGSTQYGIGFDVNSLAQNGFPPGELSSIDINAQGVVFARYTNGQTEELSTLAMMNIVNPQGLSSAGDSNWAITYDAGDPIEGTAQSGSIGSIVSGALEQSNVDVAEQLVNLITAQRNYQANAQVISTADTVTQTIINLR